MFRKVYTMENGRMLLHSVIIGFFLYVFMIFILAQKQLVAENRSILLASLILIYMILLGIYIFLFGHELLNSIKIF